MTDILGPPAASDRKVSADDRSASPERGGQNDAAALLLRICSIRKRYGGVTALKGIDLELRKGEVHCLIGENGSGKSTLIKILSGVTAPDAGGTIEIDGERFALLSSHQSISRGIQVIYQDLSLFPHLTVAENIAFARHLTRGMRLVRRQAYRSLAAAILARVGVALDVDCKVGKLSIANRQVVAICRALSTDARLIIMDEPTASLTRQEIERLLNIVADLKHAGIATLFVSHRLKEITAIAERITVLRDGEKVGTYDSVGMDHHRLAHLMTGLRFEDDLLPPVPRDAPVALRIEKLCRAGQYAEVSFEVRAGEIVGLIGRLGAGRTELALSLFGMNPPDSGTVTVGDAPLDLRSNRACIRGGVAYVSEDRLSIGLVMQQSIGANVLLTMLDRHRNAGALLDERRCDEAVKGWIGDLGIKTNDPNRAVSTLSGGNQQRVVLAKWMATRPKLLILDSPTVGVDIAAKGGIYEIVRSLARTGVAIIMISDEAAEVVHQSNRILVLREGSILAEVDPGETTEEDLEALIDA